MDNYIFADCCEEELQDLKKGLEDGLKEKCLIISAISNWGRTNIWLKIKRYLIYFIAPLKVFFRRKKIKRLFGWQQFYTIIFCFYCRIFHVKKTFSVYVINFTYREKNGIIGKLYHSFMKYSINNKYVDLLFVPSIDYIDICSKSLEIDSSKIKTLPFGIPDQYERYKDNYIQEKYILSIGRSNRDYDWLINEWNNIDYPLYIISDTYKYNKDNNNNIKIINNISGDKQFPYIMGCKALIIPIKQGNVCSGDTVLLTAMSFKKNVIVTDNSTLSELYVINNNNGYIVDKNNSNLKEIIDNIISNKIDLGEKARKSYLDNYSRIKMGNNISKIIKGEK